MSDGTRRASAHALAWGATVLVYLLVVRPVLEMAALDFELVIVNQYELDAASLEAIPWGRAVVRFAPLPLILAGVLHLAYRAMRRWTDVPGPLAFESARTRWLVGGLLALPFLVATVPLAIAMTILVAVEVYTWVEWHLEVDPAVEWAFAIVPTVAIPCLVWAAWRTVRSFRDKPRRTTPARSAGELARRVAIATPSVVLLVASIGLALATVPQASKVVGTDGGATYAEHCGRCHFRTAPLSYSKTPFEWGLTVERMRVKIPGVIDDDERDAISAFLENVRATDDPSAFRTRCQRCHGTTWRAWEPRPREEWQALVDRMTRWSPDYYRQPVAAQVVDFLGAHVTDEEAPTWERWGEVGRTCGPCHSIGWNAELYNEGEDPRGRARAMVTRMSQKMVEPLDEAGIDRLTDDWLELIADEEQLRAVFPHDYPEPRP